MAQIDREEALRRLNTSSEMSAASEEGDRERLLRLTVVREAEQLLRSSSISSEAIQRLWSRLIESRVEAEVESAIARPSERSDERCLVSGEEVETLVQLLSEQRSTAAAL